MIVRRNSPYNTGYVDGVSANGKNNVYQETVDRQLYDDGWDHGDHNRLRLGRVENPQTVDVII